MKSFYEYINESTSVSYTLGYIKLLICAVYENRDDYNKEDIKTIKKAIAVMDKFYPENNFDSRELKFVTDKKSDFLAIEKLEVLYKKIEKTRFKDANDNSPIVANTIIDATTYFENI